MKVPNYENQVGPSTVRAAQPNLSAPVRAAYGEELAHAGSNLARSVGHLANASTQLANQYDRALERQRQRDKSLRKTAAILSWRKENDELLTGKKNEDGSIIEGGLLTKELSDAAGITATYDEKAKELMQKHLATATTPEEREEWALAFEQDYQNNFDAVARHQYKQQRAQGELLTKAYGTQQEGLAGAIRTADKMRANLDDTYKVFNENDAANGVPEDVQKLTRYGVAAKNVKAAVEGAVFEKDINAARSVLDGVKDDLLPDDYNKLSRFVDKAKETLQKATDAESAAPLYERALQMAETNPDDLQKEVVQILRNPASALVEAQQQFGNLKPKQLVEYANWVQKNLLDADDTRSGQAKIENWQRHESGFADFGWKKKGENYQITNKDMKNPQTVLAAIGALQGHIDHHDFSAEDTKKAKKHLSQLRTALGSMDMKANDTALGEIVRQTTLLSAGRDVWVDNGSSVMAVPGVIAPVFQREYDTYTVGGILSAEEKGIIVEQAVQLLQATDVNLLAEDRKTRALAVEAVQGVARDYVKNKFAVVRDDVTDVQVGDNTFKSYGIKPNPNLGASITTNLDGYRYEEHNDVAYLVKRDKNNKVLHRQLL